MNKAVVYHWWAEWEPTKYVSAFADTPLPYKNLRVPVVLSIATLRAHNNYIPVYVLDCNDYESDWMEFPEHLDFKVVKWTPHLQDYKNKNGWKNLSRIGDIRKFSERIPEDEIIYSDSDVFWLKNPLPLMATTDKFCFNHYNSGFYYYDKTAKDVKKFLDLFEAYVLISLNDKEIRKRINKTVSWDFWYYVLDEVVMTYMREKESDSVNQTPLCEHGLLRDILVFHKTQKEGWPTLDVKDLKMFHSNGVLIDNKFHKVSAERKHARGLVCLIFKELYDAVTRVLSQEEVEMIFTKEELNYYLPLQLELLSEAFVQKLRNTFTEGYDYNEDISLKKLLRP